MRLKRLGKWFKLFVATVIAITVLVYFKTQGNVYKYSDVEKCPYCYGETLCEDFKEGKIRLRNDGLTYTITNAIGSKNVYFAIYGSSDVVLKKLGQNTELQSLDEIICRETGNLNEECNFSSVVDVQDYHAKILLTLKNTRGKLTPFTICSDDGAKILYQYVQSFKPPTLHELTHLKNVWTLLNVNAELIMLQLLKSSDKWPVPRYYGTCGRFVVEENSGESIANRENCNWVDRAFMALQLLRAAKNFTSDHPDFRFYLTDVSPDNVVVDEHVKVTFIDLENVVITQKMSSGEELIHRTLHTKGAVEFSYSEDDLCGHTVSDHNYYSICYWLLSPDAPWPMMKNGLLHDPPSYVLQKYGKLYSLIKDCVNGGDGIDRFETSEKLMKILTMILNEKL